MHGSLNNCGMQNFRVGTGWLVWLLVACAVFVQADEGRVMTQWSTIDAVLKGHYYGAVTLDEAARHGDFAIGTLEHLDGELVALDGKFYQVDDQGKVHLLKGDELSPFIAIAKFQTDIEFEVPAGINLTDLQDFIDSQLPSANYFYAVRIEGTFASMRTRSVGAQTLPYPPLIEVVETQSVFDYPNSTGTLVGFRCPPYAKTLNVPGYHLHYLAADLSGGGHLLGLETAEGVKVQIGILPVLSLRLPENYHFRELDLSGDNLKELHEAELERN